MRLIGTLPSQKLAEQFSNYLTHEGIRHQFDIILSSDWGSETYGTPVPELWIIDEDQVQKAKEDLELFLSNPDDPKFKSAKPSSAAEHLFSKAREKIMPEKPVMATPPPPPMPAEPMGPLTFYILLLCSWIYLWGAFTTPYTGKVPLDLAPMPFYTPSINKVMMYDWPNAYVYLDKLIALYGVEKIANPTDLPIEGQYLLKQYFASPIWQGLYPIIEKWANPKIKVQPQGPLFERVKEGEIWRTVTPIFLHSDVFHILFNMLWLILLGKQMENRIRALRYIVFIVIAGLFSNTCQYLMGGANFIGFSGVLCAMLTFILVRKKIAPWEGYQLQSSTANLLLIFIFAMAGLQAVSFLGEALFKTNFTIGIANSAHLSGAFIGVILGRFNFFSWQRREKTR